MLLASFPSQVAIPLPEGTVTVGREWLAQAGITDAKVSTNHIRFTRTRDEVWIEDAGSRNGTWLNGCQLGAAERASLEDGAVLRLGRTLFVYRKAFEGAPAPEPSLGEMVGPFGLTAVRSALSKLAARPDKNVLIQGETGSGKELLAAEVVRALGRGGLPICPVNVAGIAPAVFEAQLFGWKKGAFTGSTEASPGVLRQHDRGSVFLDEIGELHSDLQPKLLRVLQDGGFLPVGESKPVYVDVVLVAATNRPLEASVEEGRFRADLFARFTTRLFLPPLRERPEDLFAIAQALWRKRVARPHADPTSADVEAIERMMLDPWPANVRDLERLLLGLDPEQGLLLEPVARALGPLVRTSAPPITPELIEETIKACGGNESEAARQLGMHRGKLRRERAKLKRD